MNINRHNYEEYFILYVDNELGSEDRRRVEEFVKTNPDLQEELDILSQTKLVPEAVVFEGKEELLQFTTGFATIDLSNYEEWLVLYMDNELTAEQKAAVEGFVAVHPPMKDALNSLLKTKLEPEAVIFPDKKSLYRKEKTRPIVWWRVAAAAAVLLAISATVLIIGNRKTDLATEEIAKTPSKTEQQEVKTPVVPTKDNSIDEPISPEIANSDQPVIPQSEKQNNAAVVTAKKESKKDEIKTPGNVPMPEKQQELVADNTPVKQSPNNSSVKNDNTTTVNPVTETVTLADNNKPHQQNSNISAVTQAPVDTYITKADAPANPDNEDITYANETTGKKNKLRGFLRKVTRTFEKTTKVDATDDDDRLLVGGLALRLK